MNYCTLTVADNHVDIAREVIKGKVTGLQVQQSYIKDCTVLTFSCVTVPSSIDRLPWFIFTGVNNGKEECYERGKYVRSRARAKSVFVSDSTATA